MSQQDQLLASAKKLLHILNQLDLSKPLLEDACSILRPIIAQVISGETDLPTKLPNRTFFFGMYEQSLPAHYLNDIALMNAIGEFDSMLQNPCPADGRLAGSK